jgi:hypothetical protein
VNPPTRLFSFRAFAHNYPLSAHTGLQENSTVNLNRKIQPTPRNPAIQRCCIAEKRSRRDSLSKGLGIVETEVRADEAYRKALPELVGYENIRDFIACITFGMAHGNVTAFQGTKLLAGRPARTHRASPEARAVREK